MTFWVTLALYAFAFWRGYEYHKRFEKGGRTMKNKWIKVSDRLPECIFGDRQTMHYSRSVLVAMRWINGCSSYWVIRIACYDKLLDQWLDHNDVPYENVEYWQPIELPEEE